jgi:serine phosphatase RsbU (regulator of sigma subunit)/Tfp pilus assembly protein PilF
MFSQLLLRAQKIDSLKLALKSATHDTISCNILNEMIDEEADDKIWPTYNEQVKNICEKNLKVISKDGSLRIFYLKNLANSFNNAGFLANQKGEIDKAILCFNKGLGIQKDIKDKKGIAYSLNNIGAIYRNKGDILKALDYYHQSLKIQEELDDKKAVAICLNNIGAIYKNQGLLDKALACFNKCLIIQKEIADESGIARSFNNLGLVYQNKGNDKKAMFYYEMSLNLYEKLKAKQGIANILKNIGSIYQKNGEISKALDCFNKSLEIQLETKDKQGITQSYIGLGRAYLEAGKTSEALLNAKQALIYGQELGYPELISNSSNLLSKIYSKKGDYKSAFEMHQLYKQMADSMTNDVNRKASIQKAFQYAYDKKIIADSIRVSEERKGFNYQIKQEKSLRNVLYASIGFIAIFLIFTYNRFRITRKQKYIIELQKTEVDRQRELADSRRETAEYQKQIIEIKQKEILDSIHYAKSIQQAMLTSEEYINLNLLSNNKNNFIGASEYFILYQPKDIVSGDFYWAVSHNQRFYMTAADCTGHGVPGAFMSLLNISYLSENVIGKNIIEPSDILNAQREEIIKALNPTGTENSKDGMDCVLCAFDFSSATPNRYGLLNFALANNPLWIIRNGELIEFKADKMPVSKHEGALKSYTSHSFDLQKGDTVYLFTDGYADQFGGAKGKKFKYKHLKEILQKNISLSMQEQKELLLTTLIQWKGSLDQVDDILIIGVRV